VAPPAVSRRRFLQAALASAAALPFAAPRIVRAQRMLRHATIGANGQAFSDVNAFARHPAFQLVAAADVDLARFDRLQARFPAVRVYQDWRDLLDREDRHIDAVNVSVPDHMHGGA
jgi:predicted dehydrogenase